MSWQKTWGGSLRVVGGLSAALLTVAAVLYAPYGLGPQSPAGMAVRAHLLLAVLVISAAATWLVAIKPDSRGARIASSAASGFNGIWIFSFVGLPVVVASLVATLVSAFGVPRRLAIAVVVLPIAGLGLGLLVIRLTQPPGEHIFG